MTINIDDYDEGPNVNYTKLAEDCCDELNLYENDSDIPDILFDMSVNVESASKYKYYSEEDNEWIEV